MNLSFIEEIEVAVESSVNTQVLESYNDLVDEIEFELAMEGANSKASSKLKEYKKEILELIREAKSDNNQGNKPEAKAKVKKAKDLLNSLENEIKEIEKGANTWEAIKSLGGVILSAGVGIAGILGHTASMTAEDGKKRKIDKLSTKGYGNMGMIQVGALATVLQLGLHKGKSEDVSQLEGAELKKKINLVMRKVYSTINDIRDTLNDLDYFIDHNEKSNNQLSKEKIKALNAKGYVQV